MATRVESSLRFTKKAAVVGSLVLATSAVSIVAFDFLRDGGSEDEGVIHTIVRSEILGQDRDLLIHLPRHYDSTGSYPVVYVLDGSSQDGHVAVKFDVLSSAGIAPQAIVVGIPNMTAENRERQLVPPFMKTDVEKPDSPYGEGEKFLSFVKNELFPFINERYAASQTRLLMGHSRSGLLVTYSLLYRPEMFQARFCYSTPLWRQDNILVTKTEEFLRAKDSLRSFFYMSVGEKETENIRGGFERMTQAFKRHAPAGFVWYADLTPGADHQDNAQISAAAGIARWGELAGK
jgi:predicted alpha/beta superfamily hydrolase